VRLDDTTNPLHGTSVMPLTIRHIGKLGDVVYSMAAMRGLWLTTNERSRVILHYSAAGGAEPKPLLSLADAEWISPLLESQGKYIEAVEFVEGPVPNYADDRSDHSFVPWILNRPFALDNLARSACLNAHVDPAFASVRWIEVEAEHGADTYVHWTGRYPNKDREHLWQSISNEIPDTAIFIGSEEEKAAFEAMAGKTLTSPPVTFANMVLAARKIQGCAQLFCNQSCFLALAHALGKPVTVEAASQVPDCIFLRSSARYLGATERIKLRFGVQCVYDSDLQT
jgi:hypothetical protein